MKNKTVCRNMNHGKTNPPVLFCPNCGEKFKPGASAKCSEAEHKYRRKTGCSFCFDCGKDLKAT